MVSIRNNAVLVSLCLLLTASSLAFGQFDPALTLRDDNINSLPVTIDWFNRQYFSADTDDNGTHLRWLDNSTKLSVPIIGSDGDYDLSAQIKYRGLDFKGQPLFGDPLRQFPDELYDVSASVTGRKLTEIGLFGLSVAAGSASDRPFASMDETSLSAGGWWTIRSSDKHSWQLMLYYDSGLNMLLPGASWIFTPNRELILTVGAPATSLKYNPIEDLEIFAMATVFNTAKAKISYDITELLTIHADFDWTNDAFRMHDRNDNDHSLFYYETTASGGLRFNLTDNIYIDLDGGWSFNRYWFEEEDYGDRHDNRLDLDDAAFVGLTASIEF